MDFRPPFTAAFGLNGREATFRLECGQTHQWDLIFGSRWDVVHKGEYLVTRISFKRERIGRRFIVSEKLRCTLALINCDCSEANYRSTGVKRLMDKFRTANHNETIDLIPQAFAATQGATEDEEATQPSSTSTCTKQLLCLCPECYSYPE